MEVEKSVTNSAHQEVMEKDRKRSEGKKLGGIRAVPFILANEICDRIANVGSHSNMISFFTLQLNMPLVQAANVISNFNGTQTLTPLLGALISDSWAGQYWTITIGSIIYTLGFFIMALSAVLPALRPPPCPNQINCTEASALQLWVLYISLFLTAVGAGGIKPCVVNFAANQLDMAKPSAKARKWNFFNWYYFSLGLATLFALTVIVYIQDNVSWAWGLGIPTIVMAVAVAAFVIGSPFYKKVKPSGSPFTRLTQVVVASIRKRKAIIPSDPSSLYENKELDAAISKDGRLLHTKQFRSLDKAAIVTDGEADSNPPNLWKIATVHRVEELKSIIRILPIWAGGILIFTAVSHQTSFAIQQARTMDCHMSRSFKMPPASLNVFGQLSMVLTLVFHERLLVPFARRCTKHPSGVTYLQRIGIGFLINIVSTLVAALVEIKRKSVAAHHNLLDKPNAIIPLSVFWLVPQFAIHGIAEAFMSVGRIEFMYDQSPESMRSTGAALYWISISIGNYLGTFMVTLVHKYTGKHGNWIPNRDLNRGRLEYYYLLVTGIQVVNFIYHVICSLLYTYKSLEEEKESEKIEYYQDNVHSSNTTV